MADGAAAMPRVTVAAVAAAGSAARSVAGATAASIAAVEQQCAGSRKHRRVVGPVHLLRSSLGCPGCCASVASYRNRIESYFVAFRRCSDSVRVTPSIVPSRSIRKASSVRLGAEERRHHQVVAAGHDGHVAHLVELPDPVRHVLQPAGGAVDEDDDVPVEPQVAHVHEAPAPPRSPRPAGAAIRLRTVVSLTPSWRPSWVLAWRPSLRNAAMICSSSASRPRVDHGHAAAHAAPGPGRTRQPACSETGATPIAGSECSDRSSNLIGVVRPLLDFERPPSEV